MEVMQWVSYSSAVL